jgi:hypothetical protein
LWCRFIELLGTPQLPVRQTVAPPRENAQEAVRFVPSARAPQGAGPYADETIPMTDLTLECSTEAGAACYGLLLHVSWLHPNLGL